MHDPIVTVAKTPEAVEALREVWNGIDVVNLDADIDYFLTVAGNADQVISPYVVHIQRSDLPDILVVARLENLPVRYKLAYWTFFRVTLKAIVVTFDGVLGARDPDDQAVAMATLRRLMDDGAADLILMRNVDVGGGLHAAAVGPVSGIRLARALPVDRLWETQLTGTLDAFLLERRSAKSRSSFRREDRLLHEEFGDRLKLRRFQRADEMEELCRDMEFLSTRTYQHGLGAGFSNSGMQRALVSLGLRAGNYRCWMLYVDDRPIAFWAGTAHGQSFFPSTPGFDPDYSRHSIGRYTMFRMFEDLCADEAITRIDFGRGDAQYKMEYAQVRAEATDVWIAARRLRPILAVNALSIAALANGRGRRWVENLHFGRRLKTLWRRRLAKRAGKMPA